MNPGVYFEYRPNDRVLARFAAATGDTGSDETSNFGFDWGFNGNGGAVLAAEVELDAQIAGQRATFEFGSFGTTGRTREVDGDRERGDFGLYAVLVVDMVLPCEQELQLQAEHCER